MDDLKQENGELREEVTTLKDAVERLNSMVEALIVARINQRQKNHKGLWFPRLFLLLFLSIPCLLIDLGACRITLLQKGTYLQLLKLQKSPWICVHRRVTNLWKLKFQEQRQWVSHNRTLRYQNLLSWLLHDRLCILFPAGRASIS